MSMALASSPRQYSLQLLSEYTHTTDSIPLQLSRFVGDLRELDAVLSTTMTGITSTINRLADTIEAANADPRNNTRASMSERFMILKRLSKDIEALKMGSEDKIRVASTCADELHSQKQYLHTLLGTVSHAMGDKAFKPDQLSSKTAYPHLPAQPATIDPALETRRKRTVTARSLLGGGVVPGADTVRRDARIEKERERIERDESPKKRKMNKEKEREREQMMREEDKRNGQVHHAHYRKQHRQGSKERDPNSGHHRSSHHHRDREKENIHSGHKERSHHHNTHHGSRNHPRNHQHLATAGMMDSFLSSASGSATALGIVAAENDSNYDIPMDDVKPGGEPEEEFDDPDKVYCICGTASWGEMIACDDDECAREWFHLSCLGLDKAPEDSGKWFCDECTARRAATKPRHKKSRSMAAA